MNMGHIWKLVDKPRILKNDPVRCWYCSKILERGKPLYYRNLGSMDMETLKFDSRPQWAHIECLPEGV